MSESKPIRLTIRSFFDMCSQQTGSGKALSLTWLQRMLGKPSDDQMCLNLAVARNWAKRGANANDALGIPITRDEALGAAYDLWPEVFEDGDSVETSRHDDISKISVDSAVLINLAQQLAQVPGAVNVMDDNGTISPAATLLEAKRVIRNMVTLPSNVADTTDKMHEDRREAFLKENFPTEFDKYSSCLRPTMVMEQIMLEMRDAKRPADAFPMWEKSWEQINRLAKHIFNDVTGPDIFDSQRVAIPEAVANEVIRLMTPTPHEVRSVQWRVSEPGDIGDAIGDAVKKSRTRWGSKDRKRKVRADVVSHVFTRFMVALLGNQMVRADDVSDEALKAVRSWDEDLHNPKWLGNAENEDWTIDDAGRLSVEVPTEGDWDDGASDSEVDDER